MDKNGTKIVTKPRLTSRVSDCSSEQYHQSVLNMIPTMVRDAEKYRIVLNSSCHWQLRLSVFVEKVSHSQHPSVVVTVINQNPDDESAKSLSESVKPLSQPVKPLSLPFKTSSTVVNHHRMLSNSTEGLRKILTTLSLSCWRLKLRMKILSIQP